MVTGRLPALQGMCSTPIPCAGQLPRGVAEARRDSPQRHEVPEPLRQSVVTGHGLLALRTPTVHGGVRLHLDVDAQSPPASPEANLLVNKTGKRLNPVQDRLNLQLNGWSPGQGFAVYEQPQTTWTWGDQLFVSGLAYPFDPCHTAAARTEDRALRGRNPNAAPSLHTADGPGGRLNPIVRLFLLQEQSSCEKSQGAWGTESTNSPTNSATAAENEARDASGRKASAAVPDLAQLMNTATSPFTCGRAAYALAHLGPDACPPLFEALTNKQTIVRLRAMGVICYLGTNATPVLPLLVQRLADADPSVRQSAARALGGLRLEASVVVPALQLSLQDPDDEVRRTAASALGEFGQEARVAVPSLLNLITSTDPFVREEATNAIRRITRQAPTNALQTTKALGR
jgi:hypothetical protein